MTMTTTAKNLYVVTGATGNIGHVLATKLLEAGNRVRVIARDGEKLKALVKLGAEPRLGSLEDLAFVAEAFQGATAVFAMIPPDYASPDMRGFQRRVGEVIAQAILTANVPYVVNLSSIGGHLSEGTGPILGLHWQEERLNALKGVHVLHLRPTYFLENLLHQLPLIQQQNITGSPLKADVQVPMIATRDIADAAYEALSRLDFRGKSFRELLGAQDVSMTYFTEVAAKVFGKKLTYVQFPYDAALQAMQQAGMSASTAQLMVEMNRAFNEGYLKGERKRDAANTTKTTLEQFLRIL
jgi:uncharacterized protein YbjT (DUF2867 family)